MNTITPTSPKCPSFCRFRLICPETRQQTMNKRFVSGEARGVEDCLVYPGFTRQLYVKYGAQIKGMSAEEVRDTVLERAKAT